MNKLEVCTVYGGNGKLELYYVEIRAVNGKACYDSIYIPILLYILTLVWYVFYQKLNEKRRKHLILLSVTVVLASVPCFMNYLVKGHDMEFELGRIVGVADGLASGQFPVRIHPATFAGHGYDVSVFYPELFLYLPAVLYLAGCSLVSSVHIYLFTINVASVFVMYYVAERLFHSERVGLYASVLYGLASYRLVYLFLMNGFGSGAAMIFIPLIVLGMYEILAGDASKWWILVLGMSGVLQSHVLSFVLCTLFVLVTIMIHMVWKHTFKRYLSLLYAAGMTILVNLWFIVPFAQFYFSELQTGNLAGAPAARALSLVNLLGIWPMWGMGIQTTNTPATGVPAILDLAILLGLVLYVLHRGKKWQGKQAILCVGLFALYMATKYFPWEFICNIPGLGEIFKMLQHAQRVMHVAVPCLVLVAACGYAEIETETWEHVVAIALIGILALPTSMLLRGYMSQDIAVAKGEIDTSYVGTNEYLYEGTTTRGIVPNQVKTSSDGILVSEYEKHGTNLSLSYVASEIGDGYVDLPMFFYPGYKAMVNGEVVALSQGENHVLRVEVAAGSAGILEVSYGSFKLWRVAEIVSTLAVLGWIVIPIVLKKRMEKSALKDNGDRAKEN